MLKNKKIKNNNIRRKNLFTAMTALKLSRVSAAIIAVFFVLFFLTSKVSVNAENDDTSQIPGYSETMNDASLVEAPSAILLDINQNKILYSKNIDESYDAGGLTKIASADYIIMTGKEKDKNLMYWMLMDAGTDAGSLIAKDVSGSETSFAGELNQYLSSMGCKKTSFSDASGNIKNNNKSTCRDMSIICKDAYGKSLIQKIMSTDSYSLTATDRYEAKTLWQQNQMLITTEAAYYSYCTGGRLGYTADNKANFIAFAEKDGRRLAAVVMGCKNVGQAYTDTKNLFEDGFNNFKLCKPLSNFEINSCTGQNINDKIGCATVNDGSENYSISTDTIDSNFENLTDFQNLKIKFNRNVSVLTTSDINENDIKKDVSYFDNPTGNVIGKITLLWNGKSITETNITVDTENKTATLTDASSTDASAKVNGNVNIIKILYIFICILLLLIFIVLLFIHFYRLYKKNKYKNVKIHFKQSKASIKIENELKAKDESEKADNEKKIKRKRR